MSIYGLSGFLIIASGMGISMALTVGSLFPTRTNKVSPGFSKKSIPAFVNANLSISKSCPGGPDISIP